MDAPSESQQREGVAEDGGISGCFRRDWARSRNPQEAALSSTPLTPAQQAEADRIYQALRASFDTDIKQIAVLLASKPDGQLLGATEFTLRDLVLKAGAKALQAALEGRKRGAT
jgi:hypothetical protein